MADIDNLVKRIDQEFAAAAQKIETLRREQVATYQGRQQRMEKLEEAFNQLREVWRPRLEALAKKFGDKVQTTPRITPASRSALFAFQSSVAHIHLEFSASTDSEVRNVILAYNLEVLPILMRFDSHAEIEFPLDKVDLEAAGEWIDDRIVSFVKTYLSLHENDLYLHDHMVEDPVAGVRFPKFAAAASIKEGNKSVYFISEETRCQYEQRAK